MTIKELEGKRVMLSRSTITVKDDEGKTKGMVRGLCRFNDAPNSKQFELAPLLKSSGIWDNGELSCTYIDGSSLVYVYNQRRDDMYEKYNLSQFEEDEKHYQERQELLKKLDASGDKVKVVRCHVLSYGGGKK